MTQTSPAAARQLDAIPVHRKSLSQRLRENWQLYVMLLIPVVLTIVYKYSAHVRHPDRVPGFQGKPRHHRQRVGWPVLV